MTLIRDARPEDKPRLTEMMLGLNLIEDAMVHDRTTDAVSAAAHIDYLHKCVADQGGCILAAVKSDIPVGFLVAYVEEDEGYYLKPQMRRQGFISDVFVDEAMRGCGVGEQLIVEAEKRFIGMGIRRMQLSALVANSGAVRLYGRLGYDTCAVIMEKNL